MTREDHARCILTIIEADIGSASYGMGGVDKRSVEGNLNLSPMEKEANGHLKP